MWLTKRVAASAAAGAVCAGATMAHALGRPEPWQIDFQEAASPVMARIDGFFDLLLVIITLIAVFVLSLLAYVMVRFNAKRNPVPSKTSHNTLIEVLWTVVPIMILVIIAVPSFKLLYFQKVVPESEMTIKAVGNQFYWSYEYPDHDGLTFDAVLKDKDALKGDEPWLLATDNRVVVPVATNIRLLITASDVIHSWAVPSLGVKMDAVPGRLNESWMRIEREGVYYGQCSEFCGTHHGFMPIAVEAVSKEAFAAWLEKAKQEFAQADVEAARIADARP